VQFPVVGGGGEDSRELLALSTARRADFLVPGGHAVAFHGHPRYTEDLDLFVRATPENEARIVAALEAFGFGGVGAFAAPTRTRTTACGPVGRRLAGPDQVD
jgi:hypothetical protein